MAQRRRERRLGHAPRFRTARAAIRQGLAGRALLASRARPLIDGSTPIAKASTSYAPVCVSSSGTRGKPSKRRLTACHVQCGQESATAPWNTAWANKRRSLASNRHTDSSQPTAGGPCFESENLPGFFEPTHRRDPGRLQFGWCVRAASLPFLSHVAAPREMRTCWTRRLLRSEDLSLIKREGRFPLGGNRPSTFPFCPRSERPLTSSDAIPSALRRSPSQQRPQPVQAAHPRPDKRRWPDAHRRRYPSDSSSWRPWQGPPA